MPISTDLNVIRQSNGFTGEMRTAALLAANFIILKASVDRDGADYLVEIPDQKPYINHVKSKRFQIFGIIQAKFFQKGTTVYIENNYATYEGKPKENFFLLLHTDDDEKRPITYFLESKDILSLPLTTKGKRRFSITKTDKKSIFKNRKPAEICNAIRQGIERVRSESIDEIKESLTLPLAMRSSFNARDQNVEYILRIIRIKPTEICETETVSKIALARAFGDTTAIAIDARWDLFQSTSTWEWGYKGEGPKLLSMSILAHYMGWGSKPNNSQHMNFLMNVISKLDRESEHIVTGRQIEEALLM